MSTGEIIRLQRLFDGGANAVIVAVDHGLYNGPRPGFEDLAPVVSRLGGADAILLSPGMVPHVRSAFERRGAPAMILRLNWGCLLYTSPSPRDRQKSRMPSSA